MTEFATYTVNKLQEHRRRRRLVLQPGRRAGGRHHPGAADRPAPAGRAGPRPGACEAEVVDADECVRLHPLVDRERVLGGLHIPTDGLGQGRPRGRRPGPARRGARRALPGSTRVIGIEQAGGRVTGVRTDGRGDPRRHRRVLRRLLGPRGGRDGRHGRAAAAAGPPVRLDRAGRRARRPQRRAAARRAADPAPPGPGPVLPGTRATASGIGSYAPPADAGATCATSPTTARSPAPSMPSMLPFTEEDFAPAWEQSQLLLPALRRAKIDAGFNGVFSFTPDGGPLVGESAGRRGLLDRRGGLGDPLRRRRQGGGPAAGRRPLARSTCTAATCTASRTSSSPPEYVSETSQQNFVEIYDVLHPLQPQDVPAQPPGQPLPRPAGGSWAPSSSRAPAGSGRTGTRPTPRWSTSCRRSGRRRRATPGARSSTRRSRRPRRGSTRTAVAHVRHDPAQAAGGQRARRPRPAAAADHRPDGQDRRRGHLHAGAGRGGWHPQRRHRRPAGRAAVPGRRQQRTWTSTTSAGRRPPTGRVQVRDITGGTCCIGLWGPLARELVQPAELRRLLQ